MAVSDNRCDDTQIWAHLAFSVRQANCPVLLVDLDPRHTIVADALALRAAPGLANVLMGHVELPDVVHDVDHPLLVVITSGAPPESPAELPSPSAMATLARGVEQTYQYGPLHPILLLCEANPALISDTGGGAFPTVAGARAQAHGLTTAFCALLEIPVNSPCLVVSRVRLAIRPLGRARTRPTAGVVVSSPPVRPCTAVAPPAQKPSPAGPPTCVPALSPATLRYHPAQKPEHPILCAPSACSALRTPDGKQRTASTKPGRSR